MTNETWQTIQRVGFEGKQKDANRKLWDTTYGANNWRLTWQYANGQVVDFNQVFEEYVLGYTQHFSLNHVVAQMVSGGYSFTYDKELITREQAFQPLALVNIPGKANQFHHVALNIALEQRCSLPFRGSQPVQVRLGKPGLPELHPGNIPCIDPSKVPRVDLPGEVWWERGSIEDLYQSSKILQIRN